MMREKIPNKLVASQFTAAIAASSQLSTMIVIQFAKLVAVTSAPEPAVACSATLPILAVAVVVQMETRSPE